MIYLDNMGSAPLDPRVRAAMDHVLDEGPGNPHATSHAAGWRAAEHVTEARRAIAGLLDASPSEVVFTSGATEANNLAIKGAALAGKRRTVAHSAIEHPCVIASANALAPLGFSVNSVTVTEDGIVDLEKLERLIDDDTSLVSVMLANNETGAIQPIAEIADLCLARGALLHCDAAQAFGRLAVSVKELNVDLLSLSAHKFHGPMGIGALYVREGVNIAPQMHGGSQQGGLRSGTVPVPLVVGMGCAAGIAVSDLESDIKRLSAFADSLYEQLSDAIEGLAMNGPSKGRVAGCLNIAAPGVDAEGWLLVCPGLAAATGSACASGDQRPSHVLTAMGASSDRIAGSIRLSFGRLNSATDVSGAAMELIAGLEKVAPQLLKRGASPVSQ